jgi:hypothetical protein
MTTSVSQPSTAVLRRVRRTYDMHRGHRRRRHTPAPMFDTIDGADPEPNRHQLNSVARLPGPSGHARRTTLGRAARDSPCDRQAPHPARYPPSKSARRSLSRVAWHHAAPSRTATQPSRNRCATAACVRDPSAVELHGQAMPCQPAILAAAAPADVFHVLLLRSAVEMN